MQIRMRIDGILADGGNRTLEPAHGGKWGQLTPPPPPLENRYLHGTPWKEIPTVSIVSILYEAPLSGLILKIVYDSGGKGGETPLDSHRIIPADAHASAITTQQWRILHM
ncbi:hypothetical protein DPMN_165764 [Dreissena polymorpha]|uniref:Uncharacterized protein n=1 Tax=Dreissena polymorpha TaxID=45954 RepID=A0A9D4F1A9_DREPO|nr:hypothetical protein DPMN_165764 [Dreissena polymorpha]